MSEPNELFILWTNADIETSEKMVMMYATNSMLGRWWEEVTVVIWGATTKMVAENAKMQGQIQTARRAGVRFLACKACADQLGVTNKLVELGVNVLYWGDGLTNVLKEGKPLLTI